MNVSVCPSGDRMAYASTVFVVTSSLWDHATDVDSMANMVNSIVFMPAKIVQAKWNAKQITKFLFSYPRRRHLRDSKLLLSVIDIAIGFI